MVGTALGKEYNIQTDEYDGEVPGELLAVVHIRYVEPEVPETTLGQQQ